MGCFYWPEGAKTEARKGVVTLTDIQQAHIQETKARWRLGISVAAAYLLLVAPLAAQKSQADLEREFSELLSGANLVGQFTIITPAGESPMQPDSYSISKISKMEDGRWLFTASMSFGNTAIAVPMPFDVEWAGDTPMITLTDQTIEGLGTFSARVLIYDGLYAGTWKHDVVGGHMWGRIEKPGEADKSDEPNSDG